MSNKLTKTAMFSLLAVLVMALGAVVVFAQDDAPVEPGAPETPAMPFGRGNRRGHGGFHGRGMGGDNDEALAGALGITVDELQAARQKVAADRLAQAVEAGYLTHDQANTMLAIKALKGVIDRKAILAEALGIDADNLDAAREDGTLADQLSNMTPAELQEKMQAAVQAAIQQAVTDTIITQDQADLVREQIENGLGMRGKFGGHQSFGGKRGGFHDYHGFHGAPQGDADGEAFAPLRMFQNAPAFGV